MKTKKLRNVGKSKSTDTEEEDAEDEENVEGAEENVEDNGKYFDRWIWAFFFLFFLIP